MLTFEVATGSDLNLLSAEIVVVPVPRSHIKYSRVTNTETRGTYTYRMGHPYEVRVATQRALHDVVSTLAHELRHVWQHVSEAYEAYDDGTRRWWGSLYVPTPRIFSVRTPYMDCPDELDARCYEEDALVRLFGIQERCAVPDTRDYFL